MDFNRKSTGEVTPKLSRSKSDQISRNSENFHPNMRSPSLKSSNSPSPLIKSATKSQKSAQKKYSPIRHLAAPTQFVEKIRERKFVIAKKNSKKEKPNSSTNVICNCDSKAGGKPRKCLCVASESLRASQEEFFKKHSGRDDEFDKELKKCDLSDHVTEQKEELANHGVENPDAQKEAPNGDDSNFKRTRDKLLEEARESLPESGSGRVMHLVKAFENILTLPKSKDCEEKDDDDEREEAKKGVKWALPGLQSSSNLDSHVSSDSFCPSDFFLTSENLGLSCSFDSSQGSISRRNSDDGRRSRRNSAESSGTYARRYWKRKQLRATSQKPFKLKTEQRGRNKEEEFIKKVQQMMEEEEKMRIPIAQGLPWTTDEPECLVKPPVKEITRPVDLVLHSDVRAEERAEFDHQVAEKMSLIEQYKMERERQQKLAEEEEIRRLRKELVPKAQPMPYFDRPFIPRRSMKHPTIPKEPRFHVPQHKKIKSCMSWSDFTYAELQ